MNKTLENELLLKDIEQLLEQLKKEANCTEDTQKQLQIEIWICKLERLWVCLKHNIKLQSIDIKTKEALLRRLANT